MSWINRILPSGVKSQSGNKRSSVPEGLWRKCLKCEAVLYRPDLERNLDVCPKCDHHMRIGARRRLGMFLDEDGREEILKDVEPVDRLKFRDKKRYRDRLSGAQKSTGEKDALIAMRGKVNDLPLVALAFEFNFHGGSMGYAVGEKFARAARLCLEQRLPLVCFAASGGARMQEALISLMQMAKTSAVLERMKQEGIPYISVLTDPIYGGVSASLALLGDINIAEPDARAGFAGPNIIEQTIRQKLPKGFQRSEFLLEHGAIDMIVPRGEMRDTITRVLQKLLLLDATPEEAPVEQEITEDDVSAPAAPEIVEVTAVAAAAVAAPPAQSDESPEEEAAAPEADDETEGEQALQPQEDAAETEEAESSQVEAAADSPEPEADEQAASDDNEDSPEEGDESPAEESDSEEEEARPASRE